MKGVWVTSRDCALNLAAALRPQLLEISTIKAAAGRLTPLVKGDLAVIVSESLPKDITHFAQAIVEAFIGMQKDLNEERRTAEQRWSKREKQIQRVICNTSGMYGDLQGLIGSSLHNIPALTHQSHDLGEGA